MASLGSFPGGLEEVGARTPGLKGCMTQVRSLLSPPLSSQWGSYAPTGLALLLDSGKRLKGDPEVPYESRPFWWVGAVNERGAWLLLQFCLPASGILPGARLHAEKSFKCILSFEEFLQYGPNEDPRLREKELPEVSGKCDVRTRR